MDVDKDVAWGANTSDLGTKGGACNGVTDFVPKVDCAAKPDTRANGDDCAAKPKAPEVLPAPWIANGFGPIANPTLAATGRTAANPPPGLGVAAEGLNGEGVTNIAGFLGAVDDVMVLDSGTLPLITSDQDQSRLFADMRDSTRWLGADS